ncbi:MAG: hypothetical protein Q4G36_05730 [Paracoccus sp. (in: a-proteobacteria)]|nr:hypothetical protein [Paracoccus sp. (in: a-proteobacteria)]
MRWPDAHWDCQVSSPIEQGADFDLGHPKAEFKARLPRDGGFGLPHLPRQ